MRVETISYSKLIKSVFFTNFLSSSGKVYIILLKLGLKGYSNFAAIKTETVARATLLVDSLRSVPADKVFKYRSKIVTAQWNVSAL